MTEPMDLEGPPPNQEPDLAQTVYQNLGIPNQNVYSSGAQESVAKLRPGDLVGWHGGHEPDGTYIGNMAMYVGNREILETYYGTVRRRKLGDNENVFGIPVVLPGDSPTVKPDI